MFCLFFSGCSLSLPNTQMLLRLFLLSNALSLRPVRPRHFHHITTKWNKFPSNKPGGPSLAVELSQSDEMSRGVMRPVSLWSSHSSGVSSNIRFIQRCRLIYFSQKMNSPLTANTERGLEKITKAKINYRTRLHNSNRACTGVGQ
ncbi:hypothetical protein AMECASPLE_025400 [Ameca splendens]|uniref:Secreted protein n=1 Tax=Ameca splendens TaxID=208324 RepID=A0ABV1A081_9TELE